MQKPNCVLLKVSPEISLKTSYVRAYFLNKLIVNAKQVLREKGLSGTNVVKGGGRLYVFPNEKKNVLPVALALKGVFGVQSAVVCKMVSSKNRSEILDAALSVALASLDSGDSFAVRMKNTLEKSFSARGFEADLGSKILSKTSGLRVDLKNPKKQISVEAGPKGCFFYVEELGGVGGLPLGVEGNVAVFFEGKKEELLAAFLMMRRGCNVFPVLKSDSEKLRAHVNRLIRWNSFRNFKFSLESGIPELIEKSDVALKAVVKCETVFGPKLELQKGKFSVPVFWPLVFFPREIEKEFLKVL